MTRNTVALAMIFTFCMTVLISMAHAEDARCSQLRALRAHSASFSKETVAQAVSWYHSNCGKKAVRAAAR